MGGLNLATGAATNRAVLYVSIAVRIGSACLMLPLGVRAIQLFPDRAPPRGIAARLAPCLFSFIGLLELGRLLDLSFTPIGVRNVVLVVGLAALLLIGTSHYRQLDSLVRRQVIVPAVLAGKSAAVAPVPA